MLISPIKIVVVDDKTMYYDKVSRKVKIVNENAPDTDASMDDINDYHTKLFGNTIESEIQELIQYHLMCYSKPDTIVPDNIKYVSDFSYKTNYEEGIQYFNRKFHEFVVANSVVVEDQSVEQMAGIGQARYISLNFLMNFLKKLNNES